MKSSTKSSSNAGEIAAALHFVGVTPNDRLGWL
jgi:hypothetical protein